MLTNYIHIEYLLCSGVKIEMSLAKDQSLNFIVSGKQDSVMKARKLIVQHLQTTVRILIK